MRWYTERYDRDGIRAKSHRTFATFDDAIDDVRKALAVGEIARVMPRGGWATNNQVTELGAFGLTSIF